MKRTPAPRSGSQAERTARRLSDHPWLERLARVGYAGSGLVHLVLGWIALRVALGGSGESADQSGALETGGTRRSGRCCCGSAWSVSSRSRSSSCWRPPSAAVS